MAPLDVPRLPAWLETTLAPPRCLACRTLADPPGAAPLCSRCERLLAESPPRLPPMPGLEGPLVATAYEGPGQGLIAALKLRRIRAAAGVAAELILRRHAAALVGRPVVAVPAAPLRALGRGFDPAEEIARALVAPLGVELLPLLRRRGVGAQKRRGRRRRLLAPPRIEARGAAPPAAVLIDDVVTTGATLTACAAALHAAGCRSVRAVTFAATPRAGAALARRPGANRMGSRSKR